MSFVPIYSPLSCCCKAKGQFLIFIIQNPVINFNIPTHVPVFKQNFLRPFPLLLNFCFWSMIFSWSCLNTDMQRIKHYIVLKYYSLWLRNVTIVYHSGIQKSTTIFPLHKNSLTDRIYASLCTHALSARLVLLLLSEPSTQVPALTCSTACLRRLDLR